MPAAYSTGVGVPATSAAMPAGGSNTLALNFVAAACVVWFGAFSLLLFYGDILDALLSAVWGAAIYTLGYANLKRGRVQAAKATALVSMIVAGISLVYWLALHNYLFGWLDIVIGATLAYTYSKL